MSPPHVALVIDNDQDVLDEVQAMLRSLGHECHCAANQEEAESLLADHSFCYVVLDLSLPVAPNRMSRTQTGFNILESIRQQFAADELPVIIMTAHGSGHETPVRAFKMGASDYVKKPFDSDAEPFEDKVREAVKKSCEARHSRCPNARPNDEAERPRPEARSVNTEPTQSAGTAFRFVGTCRRRRYLMEINGDEAWVRLATFEGLFRLAVKRRESPPGWISGAVLSQTNFHSVIHRMKRDLWDLVELDDSFLENDGHGRFRLTVPPENLTFDEPGIREGHPHLFGILRQA